MSHGAVRTPSRTSARGTEGKKSGDGAGGFAGFFLVAPGKQLGIDRDERSGEDTFAKEILQEIGDSEGGFEDVGGIGIAKVMRENAIADQASDATEENSGRHKKSEAPGTGGHGIGGGGKGHKNVQAGFDAVARNRNPCPLKIPQQWGKKGREFRGCAERLLETKKGGYFLPMTLSRLSCLTRVLA